MKGADHCAVKVINRHVCERTIEKKLYIHNVYCVFPLNTTLVARSFSHSPINS